MEDLMEWYVVDIDKNIAGPFTKDDAWKRWETVPNHDADALVVRAASANRALHVVGPLFGW